MRKEGVCTSVSCIDIALPALEASRPARAKQEEVRWRWANKEVLQKG